MTRKIQHLIIAAMLICTFASAQSAKSLQMIIIPPKDMPMEKLITLRIMLSHFEATNIIGFRTEDKSFVVSSGNAAAASKLGEELKRVYPEVSSGTIEEESYVKMGFTQVSSRIIKNETGYPVYIITGDQQLDEMSYRHEKQAWLIDHPKTSN
jgi:hypothetical protein